MAALTDPLIEIFELNTRLFRNCLAHMDDSDIRRRVTGNTNTLHFLGCHLADERFFIPTLIGIDSSSPFPELDAVRSVDEMPQPGPSLKSILQVWDDISSVLPVHLRATDEATLMSESPVSFPIGSSSILAGLGFLMQHESYHIGQMALLRKALGFGPMSYR